MGGLLNIPQRREEVTCPGAGAGCTTPRPATPLEPRPTAHPAPYWPLPVVPCAALFLAKGNLKSSNGWKLPNYQFISLLTTHRH